MTLLIGDVDAPFFFGDWLHEPKMIDSHFVPCVVEALRFWTERRGRAGAPYYADTTLSPWLCCNRYDLARLAQIRYWQNDQNCSAV
jgi:hypothetical protein